MSDRSVYFNGIRPDGSYAREPLSAEELADRLPEPEEPREDSAPASDLRLPRPDVVEDARELEQTGWGVVWPAGADPEIRRALQPLLDHRRRQATRLRPGRYRDDLVVTRGQTAAELLDGQRVMPGPADPDVLPYNLLLVGDPSEIGFDFQFDLDVQHAVGRLHFDEVEDYRRYAENLVAVEERRPRRGNAAFFAAANGEDRATRRTTEQLVEPLVTALEDRYDRWRFHRHLRGEATRDRLLTLLGGEATPDLLLTATHGMDFWPDDPRKRDGQGALLTSDWPGPDAPTEREQYLSAEDLPAGADLGGMIAVLFACFSAGTPEHDGFPKPGEAAERIAERPFVARLPQRLLALPGGGASAVVGHVDRAWTSSFSWVDREASQTQLYEILVGLLLQGYPVGYAADHLALMQLDLATRLLRLDGRGEALSPRETRDRRRLGNALRDARGFIVLGDPAARLG